MQAVSDGKIVNPYDRDQEQGWDHIDFVVDALLSEGNSGSPVLAVSCSTRELHLVGMYHAGYKGHSALNVVVGIDQLTEFMRRKKRVPRSLSDSGSGLAAKDRTRLIEALERSSLPLFDFGGVTVRAEERDGVLAYHFYGKQFPLDDRRVVVIEDLAHEGTCGEIGRLFVPGPPSTGGAGPWRAWPPSALGTDERDLLSRTVDSLRVQVLHQLDYRHALANVGSSDDRRRGRDLSRAIARDSVIARDLVGALLETTERLAIGHDTPAPPAGSISEVPPAPAAPPAAGLPSVAKKP
jgi:serine protease Do